jgi:hypothetical protein
MIGRQREDAVRAALAAVSEVAHIVGRRAGIVRRDGRAAEMVAVQVAQRAVRQNGDALPREKVYGW